MTGFLTHRGMIIDRRQRNALKGQFNSAQGKALGKQDTTPPNALKGQLKTTTWN